MKGGYLGVLTDLLFVSIGSYTVAQVSLELMR